MKATKPKSPSTKPKTITYPKHTAIKIRPVVNATAGNEYGLGFLVDVPHSVTGGSRLRRQFPDLQAAKDFASTQNAGVHAMGRGFLGLSDRERKESVEAWDIIRPMGISLIEAAKFAASRMRPANGATSAKAAVADFIASKRASGASARYLDDLESRLERFADDFDCNLGGITTRQIDEWLRGLELGTQSVLNYRRVIGTLFNHAIRQGFLPKDFVDHELVDRPKVRAKDVTLFTPTEAGKLLAAASRDFLPVLAVQLFAGVRSAECLRLTWEDIDLVETVITVKAGKAKTGSRRTVPILPNLSAWLTPLTKKAGKLWHGTSDDLANEQRKTAKAAGLVWKHNAPRHSFTSYRLAVVKDAAKVSLECGNSPKVIFAHYNELVKPSNAEKWFSIAPEAAENLVPMAGQAA